VIARESACAAAGDAPRATSTDETGVELYRDTLKIRFPVALGDAATIAPLGDVHLLPTTIIVNCDGRIAQRIVGGIDDRDLQVLIIPTAQSCMSHSTRN
jgi:hypothetical protein